uniref:phage tail assembly protein n=1 Tax=Scandinavium goeteborgense TaxID=1851514 RepID=UPI00135C8AED|nr:phage tail assembly protein [Scandinavium goeteborgense]
MTYPANTTLITLSRPMKLNGEDIESIQMREPTVFDKLLFEKNKGAALEKEVAMIAGLCSINPGDLHQLPAYDYDQLTEAFNDFLLPPAERSNLSS